MSEMASFPRGYNATKDHGVYYPTNPRRPAQRIVDRVRATKPEDSAAASRHAQEAILHGQDIIIDNYLGLGRMTVAKAHEERLDVEVAVALREQESGGRRIFGCDHGDVGDKPPFCHQHVTFDRVEALRAKGTYRHGMNGVGETQVTWWEFVEFMHHELGGAHTAEAQLIMGFRILAAYLDKYPALEAYGAYNAGEVNRRMVINSYSRPMARRVAAWRERLYG